MLLLLIACGSPPKDESPPTESTPAEDSSVDSSPPEPLPDGDNLVSLDDWSLGDRTLLESTGLINLDGRYVAACFGAQPLRFLTSPTLRLSLIHI